MVVHKYHLTEAPEQVFNIEGFEKVLSVVNQRNIPTMYVLKNDNPQVTTIQVLIQLTGYRFHPTDLSLFTFQGTILTSNDSFVMHVWTRSL